MNKTINLDDIEGIKEDLLTYFAYQNLSTMLLRKYLHNELPKSKTFRGICPVCGLIYEGDNKDLIVRQVAKHTYVTHLVPNRCPIILDTEYFEDFVEESV